MQGYKFTLFSNRYHMGAYEGSALDTYKFTLFSNAWPNSCAQAKALDTYKFTLFSNSTSFRICIVPL